MLQRGVGGLGLLVVQDCMTLGEGTTLNILTGNTDVVALIDKRTKRESFSGSPVNALALTNDLLAVGQDTLQVTVKSKVLRSPAATDLLSDILQHTRLNGGGQVRQDLGSQLLRGLETVPGGGEPFLARGLVVLATVKAVVEHSPDPLLVLVDVLLGERALSNQLLDVLVELVLLLGNALVHQGLGEGRLVSFVVTLLTVANNVNDDIALELRTPVSSDLANEVDSLSVITVHVEHGSVNRLGDVRAVRGGTGKTRVGGETDLVVDNDVNGSSGGVSGQRVETHGLVHYTLSGKGRITVQKHTHGAVEILLIVVVVLDGTGLTQDNGVLGFQVGGVGNQGELDALAGRSGTLEVHTQVVLHVTRALVGWFCRTGKLAEDGLVGLTDDVGEDVETTTVRHTNDNVLDTILDTTVDQGLHTRDERLTTLQTETLVVGELGGQEGLEAVRPDETVEDPALVVHRVLVTLGDLEAVTDPIAGLAIGDVDVLNTVRTTVDLLAGVNDLAQGHLLAVGGGKTRQDTRSKGEFLIEIALGEVVVLELELLGLLITKCLSFATDTERVDLSLVVTTRLVSADQKLDLQVIRNIRASTQTQTLTRHALGHTTCRCWDQGRGRLEGLGDGHVAIFHVLEVGLPRDVNTGWISLPSHVHLIDVVGGVTLEEGIIGVLFESHTTKVSPTMVSLPSIMHPEGRSHCLPHPPPQRHTVSCR